MSAENADAAFDALIRWLERDHAGFQSNVVCRNVPGSGRSLFAARDLGAGQTLLQIPASALLNPLSLARSGHSIIPPHLFPTSSTHPPHARKKPRTQQPPASSRKLNTTQLLTLQLALTRRGGASSSDPWQPYLATLPSSFTSWHPLTWLADTSLPRSYRKLVDQLPDGAKQKLEEARGRFDGDMKLLRAVMVEEEPFASTAASDGVSEDDLLWAWLTVNTRTVSIPLGISGPNELQNHTLVPLLDFINHSSDRRRCCPTPRQYASSPSSERSARRNSNPSATLGAKTRPAPPTGPHGPSPAHFVPGRIGFRIVAGSEGIKAGDELFFQYGGHCNSTLFSEYGFVDTSSAGDDEEGHARLGKRWLDNIHGEIDVGWAMEDMWDEIDQRTKKERTLRAIGCWNANALRTSPTPPHPSYALQMSLRVLQLSSSESTSKLRAIEQGAVTYVSPTNEAKAVKALETICRRVVSATEERMSTLQAMQVATDVDDAQKDARDMALALNDEELTITRAVLNRIERGDTSW